MEDREIVDLYWARQEAAIRETEKKYGAFLSKIAYNILGSLEDSSECVNDTYLAAWNAMPEYRPERLPGFLAKMTRGLAIDVFRKRTAQKRGASQYTLSLEELSQDVAGNSGAEDALDAALLRDAIEAFVKQLPNETRRIFLGRYFFFDSLKDISGYTGVPEKKLKGILYRTRQKLRKYLIEEGFEV